MSALTDLLHTPGRLRDGCLQQRIQMADSVDAGGAHIAVQLTGTEPVLEQKEGPIRGAAPGKQGNLQQHNGSQELAAAGEAPPVREICETGCQRGSSAFLALRLTAALERHMQ